VGTRLYGAKGIFVSWVNGVAQLLLQDGFASWPRRSFVTPETDRKDWPK
jgi:hypothetical protein